MGIEDLKKLKDKYAIVGVGYTPQGKVPGRTALSFYLEAGINAVKDAGLKKEALLDPNIEPGEIGDIFVVDYVSGGFESQEYLGAIGVEIHLIEPTKKRKLH